MDRAVHWVVAFLLLLVLAWRMWLLFRDAIAKEHGVEALTAAPPTAQDFPVTAWVSGLRAIGPWVMELLGRGGARTQAETRYIRGRIAQSATYREIADELRWSVGAVTQRVYRLRKHIYKEQSRALGELDGEAA
jgi:hypothetical protein